MEYSKRSVNGDAGEYFLAYKMTKILDWPCRLYGVDLGVDAELEIMNSSNESTGDIIKIQIKSVDEITRTDSVSIFVDDRHINYWKRFCLPVIVCCVDLKNENVYWKQITATESYQTAGLSKKVSFCLKNDLLKLSSKKELIELACPSESKNIELYFEELAKLYDELPKSSFSCSDQADTMSLGKKIDEINKVIEKIEQLIYHFPWRLSSMALNKLYLIKRNVEVINNKCRHQSTNMYENI